jgi:hypothetical protein
MRQFLRDFMIVTGGHVVAYAIIIVTSPVAAHLSA